ncbi:MAG: hypothetical protein H0T89_07715 [Deltaproteobacteria bacterium]|nr:hypothetical protein [Deltaproteobacteria bacterium]
MTDPAGSWSIEYADGSANAYRIANDGGGATFEYRPVTAAQSSTGRYSGGEPRRGDLDAAQVAELWRQVAALEANPKLQTTDRMKGTGSFRVTDAAGARAFIILRGPALLAFDALLAAY